MECKFILLNHRTQVTFANFPLGCLKGKRLLRVDIPGYYCLISSGDGPAAECRVPLLYQTGYWATLPQAVESVRDKRLLLKI